MATRELNTKEAQAGFAVAHMTLYNYWNKGKDGDPLPSEVKGGRRIFKLHQCERWAKKHGLEFKEPKPIPLGSVGRKPAEAKPAKKAATPVVTKAATAVKQARKPTVRERQRASVEKVVASAKKAASKPAKAETAATTVH